MELKNWRAALFVQDGEYPTYLPETFRLPNGDTRKSNNCCIEDINEAGFSGPVDQPPLVPLGKTLVWDAANSSWSFESHVKVTDPNSVHEEVLQVLTSELVECGACKNGEELSPASKRRVWEYQGKIQELLHKVRVNDLKLTWENVPSKEDLNLITLAEAQSAVDAYLGAEKVKEFYELYGLIYTSSGIEVELINLPSTWVPGSSALPANIFNNPYFIPPGYVLSDQKFEEEGYYYVETKESYDEKISAKLSARLEARAAGSTEG